MRNGPRKEPWERSTSEEEKEVGMQQRKRRNRAEIRATISEVKGSEFQGHNVQDNKQKTQSIQCNYSSHKANSNVSEWTIKGEGRDEDSFRWGRMLACLQNEKKGPVERQEESL